MSPAEYMLLTPSWKADQIKQINVPWIRYFIMCDPMDYLKEMNGSCLSLYGSLDLQVPPIPNAEIMEELFISKAEGGFIGKVKTYKGLNHLFQNADTGMVTEYGQIQETMEPDVLIDIIRWIKAGN